MGLVNKETDRDVNEYIERIENRSKREDSQTLLTMMKEITGCEPKIWGDNLLIGFGKYTYTRKGKKEELEWFHVGFAPRKSRLTVYLTYDINEEAELLEKLGKAKWGKGCLHINKLADVDLAVLGQLIEKSKDATWR